MHGDLCLHAVFLQQANLSQKQDEAKATFALATRSECGTNCSITSSDIVSSFYSCSATDTTAAIFHARITLSLPILESAETVQAIKSAVQEWTSTSPQLLIDEQILVVDGSCQPVVNSFLDPECGMTETSAPSLELFDDLTIAIVMGILAIPFIILVVILIITCCILCHTKCKQCQRRGK